MFLNILIDCMNLIDALITGEKLSFNNLTNLSSLDLAIIKEGRIDLPASAVNSGEIFRNFRKLSLKKR